MKKFLLFSLSFLTTALFIINTDTFKQKLVEKGAVYLENLTGGPLFFHYKGGFECSNVLFCGQHIEKISFNFDYTHFLNVFFYLSDTSYIQLKKDHVQGIYEGIPFNGSYSINLTNRTVEGALILPTLNGRLQIDGPLSKPHIHATLDHPAHIELKGVVTDSFELKLQGVFKDSSYAISGPIRLQKGQLYMDDLRVAWKDFKGHLSAIYNLKERIVQGKGELFSSDFYQGTLNLNFSVLTSLNEQMMPLSPQLQLSLETSLKNEALIIQGLKAELHLDEIETSYIHCTIQKVSYLGQELEQIGFQWALLEKERAPFKIEGVFKDPFTLYGSTSSCFSSHFSIHTSNPFKIFLEKIEGLPFNLEKEGLIAFDSDKVSVEGLSVRFKQNLLALSYTWEKEQHALTLDVPSLDFSSLPFFPLKGEGNCLLKVEKKGDRLKGALFGKVKNFEALDFKALPLFPLNGDLQLEFNEQLIGLTGTFLGACQEEIHVAGQLPFPFRDEEPLQIDIGITGELSPFLKSWMSDTTLATGTANCNLQLRGTLEHPLLTGSLSLTEGSYESLTLGCSFQELRGLFKLEKGVLTCERLNGRDNTGGIITGHGKLSLEQSYPFDFLIETKNVQLLHLDYANAIGSGQVRFRGNEEGGKFDGELTINRLDVRLPDSTPSRLNSLEVEYINQPKELTPPTVFTKNKKRWPLALNIALSLPRQGFVMGSQFRSEWGGRLELKGFVADPQLIGDIKILNGNFLFNGKNFTCNEGTVHFGRKSTLYLIAKHDVGDVEVNLILKGLLKEPEVAFRSNPPKSSREILSLLLFNKGTGDINVEESQELSRNIIKLSDQLASGPNLLDRFRSSLGIDRIDITATDSDEMSVRVGKYLTNRLFLSLKKSMDDQPNQASLEADLTNNFKAQAEVGDDAEARLLLKWEKDY